MVVVGCWMSTDCLQFNWNNAWFLPSTGCFKWTRWTWQLDVGQKWYHWLKLENVSFRKMPCGMTNKGLANVKYDSASGRYQRTLYKDFACWQCCVPQFGKLPLPLDSNSALYSFLMSPFYCTWNVSLNVQWHTVRLFVHRALFRQKYLGYGIQDEKALGLIPVLVVHFLKVQARKRSWTVAGYQSCLQESDAHNRYSCAFDFLEKGIVAGGYLSRFVQAIAISWRAVKRFSCFLACSPANFLGYLSLKHANNCEANTEVDCVGNGASRWTFVWLFHAASHCKSCFHLGSMDSSSQLPISFV